MRPGLYVEIVMMTSYVFHGWHNSNRQLEEPVKDLVHHLQITWLFILFPGEHCAYTLGI